MRLAAIVSAGLLATLSGVCAHSQAPPNANGQSKPSQAQSAQPAPKKPAPQTADANPEGMPCSRVLALSSTDYIAKTTAINDSAEDGQLRGIRKYGSCYDARTDALAASLARSGKGPSKAARDEFASLEKDIRDFTTKALADVPSAQPGTGTSVAAVPVPVRFGRANYAGLYEKAFRYEFYEEYAAKTAKPIKPAAAQSPAAPKSSGAKSSANPAAGDGPKSAPQEPTAEERAQSDADPVTQAKNKFGKIMEALPEDEMHEIHGAFSQVIGVHSMSEAMRLAVYRYAIYLLQPAGTKDSEPPLF
jgi:hypothetical protein